MKADAVSQDDHDRTHRASARVDEMQRGPRVRFLLDGRPMECFEGESVAAALLAAGRRTLSRTGRHNLPRGASCGMGICCECVMRINGRPNVLACQTAVVEGMRVETQVGPEIWKTLP